MHVNMHVYMHVKHACKNCTFTCTFTFGFNEYSVKTNIRPNIRHKPNIRLNRIFGIIGFLKKLDMTHLINSFGDHDRISIMIQTDHYRA
jgi:hypothetical protein